MPSKESPCKTVQVDSWTLIAAVSFGHGSLRTPSGLRCLYGPPSKSALRNAATELISTASRLSRVWLFLTPWTVARQAPLSMEFSRQEYWSGLSFPPLGYLPDPEIEPGSPEAPALTREFFTPEPPGKPPFPQLLWLNETLLSKGLFFLKVYLFIWLHWVLVAACRIFPFCLVSCQLRHMGSSSLIRDHTQALCTGSTES